MAISNAMKIEAIQRALNSNKNLKTCLQDVASEKSDAPGGVTISDEDVPSVREDDLRMMFAVQRTMDNIVEGAIKNSEKAVALVTAVLIAFGGEYMWLGILTGLILSYVLVDNKKHE